MEGAGRDSRISEFDEGGPPTAGMEMRAPVSIGLIAILFLQACSSRPRQFSPTLAAAPADQTQFQASLSECGQLMADGKLNSAGHLASGGAGAAAGATTMAVGGTAAAAAGGWTGLAVASATVVLLPFAAVAGAWGMAKKKKNRKERAVQQAMAGCLTERGYPVVGWEPVPDKKKPRAAK